MTYADESWAHHKTLEEKSAYNGNLQLTTGQGEDTVNNVQAPKPLELDQLVFHVHNQYEQGNIGVRDQHFLLQVPNGEPVVVAGTDILIDYNRNRHAAQGVAQRFKGDGHVSNTRNRTTRHNTLGSSGDPELRTVLNDDDE